MQSKKLIRFVESFVLLPVMTISAPLANVPKENSGVVLTPQTVFSQKINIGAFKPIALNQEIDQKVQILKAKGDAIDAYFRAHDMPLLGKGYKLAEEAEKYGLDWRLLAGIAVRESTGGKFACKSVDNNPFGWGSCKIGFKSIDDAIEILAKNLGGENPNTAHHYDGKTTKEILQKYNPPSVVRRYAEQVMAIMDEIGEVNLGNEDKV